MAAGNSRASDFTNPASIPLKRAQPFADKGSKANRAHGHRSRPKLSVEMAAYGEAKIGKANSSLGWSGSKASDFSLLRKLYRHHRV